MSIEVDKRGNFKLLVSSNKLSQGLRANSSMSRNSEFLVQCDGVVGKDGVLVVLDQLTRMVTTAITDAFPFPQIFVFTNVIIVCGLKTIYEWNGTTLSLKYTAALAGGLWSAVDFYDYVYLSNGKIAVVRDAGSYVYAISTQPHATAMCNFNGQVIIGAPDVDGLGASLVVPADPISVTVTQLGTVAVS